MITTEERKTAFEPFKQHKTDTGSTPVQISILTQRINHLAKHLETNKKDHSSRLGLLKLVGQRRRLLNFLNQTNEKQYKKVLSELKLRK
ncbi:30S ribosomal protein S15 [bacterium F11]|nr:30S ribosomal protein S15 [bacterium F11]